MMKPSYIKPVGLALTLLAAAIMQVQANQSNPTLPVHGKGAPAAPTSVTANPVLEVGTASTASASGYNDPDGDPLASWEFEWRSGPNGTGIRLGDAETYTPTDTSPVYLRGRALAGRGYPAEQLTGAWQEVVFTPTSSLPNFAAGCTQGTVTLGGLTYTCPLTPAEANAKGVVYTDTYAENGSKGPAGKIYIRQTWSQANTYCINLGNGYRLPSHDELLALHSAKGNMFSAAGWPTFSFYPSSTVYSRDYPSHWLVSLEFGYVNYGYDGYNGYTTCVRSGS